MFISTVSLGRTIISIVAAITLVLTLWGCGGSSTKKQEAPEQTGSLKRTYTLTDEQGRKAGTLILNPLGGAELRDVDGTVIGTFAPASQTQPVSPESEPEPTP